MRACKFTILIITLFITGCTIPCGIYFRNFTDQIVRLEAGLLKRSYFKKLPNTVDFYDLPVKQKEIDGVWRSQALVTWTDSVHFYIDLPAKTMINLADISNGLTLGSKSPDIILMATHDHQIDTVLTSAFPFSKTGFQLQRKLFSNPVYYYDLR